MFAHYRYRFVCLAAALIGVASALSSFWYLNAPIYDFLAQNRIGAESAEVLLIESDTKLSQSEEEGILNKLADFGVSKTVLIRDWEYYSEQNAGRSSATAHSEVESKYVNALPISVIQADFEQGRSIARPGNALLLLEPQDDHGGIIRFFDPQKYQQLGLDCIECLLAAEIRDPSAVDSRPFLINYLDNKARLPRVSADQILNDWVPQEVFSDKLVVFDMSAGAIKDVYRTNLFSTQKISFSYYVASVLNSLLTSQRSYVLPLYVVLIGLFVVGIALSKFLRDISLNSALVSSAISVFTLIGLNVVTLAFFDTFIPVVEYLLLFASYLLYAVRARNSLVIRDLTSSNGALELALAETNIHADMHDTTLCSDLHRFFSRAGTIQGLSVYQYGKSNKAHCVLTLDQVEYDDSSGEKIVAALESLSSHPQHIDLVDDNGDAHDYLLVPISGPKNLVAGIVMSITNTSEAAIGKLIGLSEKYQDELYAEIDSWLETKRKTSELSNFNPGSITGRRRILAYRNRQYVGELMNRYKQAKGNYNRLDSAVAIYDVYGKLISVNASAEGFAKRNDMVWYGSHLNDLLTQVSGLDFSTGQEVINRTLMQGTAYRFTLKRAMKDFIGVLSHRHTIGEGSEGDGQSRSFLSLEIINISNISTSARLKDSYVRDLTNQIKQDLSTLTLLVDRLSIVEQDSEKYQYLSEVIEKLNDRVRSSKEFIVDLPAIEDATHYSINLIEKIDETLKGFEQALADKNIKLVYNKPSFLSHIVLDYRNLEFVFDYLFELLLDDSIVNSVLEVSIEEAMSTSNHSISIVVKNTGYGLPQDILDAEVEGNENHPLTRCKEFAQIHGGRLDLSTTAGEGIEFCLELPVKSQLH